MLSDEERETLEIGCSLFGWSDSETALRHLEPVVESMLDRAARAAERALVERLSKLAETYNAAAEALYPGGVSNLAKRAVYLRVRDDLRAALRPEAATTERRWDECLHGVTLGSVCLDCPSKWASIPARPAATTEGAAGLKVCWRSECRNGCYYGPDACSVTAAAVHPGTEGAVEQEGAHFACCDLPDGGCGGCGNCPEHCVCDRPCGYCIAARAARGEGEPT